MCKKRAEKLGEYKKWDRPKLQNNNLVNSCMMAPQFNAKLNKSRINER